jgi:hypothetical protein
VATKRAWRTSPCELVSLVGQPHAPLGLERVAQLGVVAQSSTSQL